MTVVCQTHKPTFNLKNTKLIHRCHYSCSIIPASQ
uniref:Uncharacterized protein n=1 Tax=Anguilla anguilla TaxID=7936 RepID=A0A0E9VJB7_ANGAN